MYSQDSSDRLLSGSPDFVLDAIDNLETKVESRYLPLTAAACSPALHPAQAVHQT